MSNNRNQADRRQINEDKLTAFAADLIALCTKHGVDIEGSEFGIDVSVKADPSYGGRKWQHIGRLSDVNETMKPDQVVSDVAD